MTKLNLKKAVSIGLCGTLISLGTALALPDNVKIQLNGEWLQTDVMPFIENDRTMIPLRGVMEKLGAKVEWNEEASKVTVNTDDINIELVVGEKTAVVTKIIDEEPVKDLIELDVPSKTVNDRTFIPGRFFAETLGANVEWSEELQAMIITTGVSGVEKPIEFEEVDSKAIEESSTLSKWYTDNCKIAGIYTIDENGWKYVLVSAGEKPTGGYSIKIDSITEVTPGTAYLYAILNSPDKDSFVIQALTYPSAVVRFKKENIQKVQGDFNFDINSAPQSVINYLNDNLAVLENADSYILKLESLQNKMLPIISEEFYKEDVQKALAENSTSSISELLERATQNGFKVETAEGMYYPIIDYAKYKAFSDKASEDIKSYISIMSKQSDNPTAKDAAIAISWEELVNRTVEMERFVKNYPKSERFKEINEMYGTYKSFVFFGLNNTPLFDYESSIIRSDALAAYKKATSEISDSDLIKSLKEFISLAEKNNLKLVQEVKDFRDKLK